MGIEWTAEMREAARTRSTGRKGVSRFADDNPFYGRITALSSVRNGRNSERGRTQGPRTPTTESLATATRASVMSCRNKLVKGWPNSDEASAIRIMGVRRALRPARRCRQRVRDGQCHRVDVVRIPDTTRIGALRKTRVNTALKTRVEPVTHQMQEVMGREMRCCVS